MFVIDVSPSMAKKREIQLAPGPDGEEKTKEITNLEWALEFVLLKVQEMVCARPLQSRLELDFPCGGVHIWGKR